MQKGLFRRAASLTLGFALIGLPAALRAQSTLGTILGTATDSSGAVVPNCDVKITFNEEGTLRSLKTDANGNYEAANSKPGHYTVEVSCTGFQTSRVANLELFARQTLRVDVTLQVGRMAQTLEVNAASAGVITTETETIASSVNALQITNLPTNYRASGNGNSPYYLLQILPGMQSDSSGNLSVQGGLQSQSQFTVDGISTTNTRNNNPIADAFPSAEAVSEIKLQGVGAPAEFGDPGDVTTISKSGTNSLHGDVFWYHQNRALNALPFGAITKPAQISNDFGGSAGGPVVIPHVYNGKNKSFFFADYEGFRLPRTSVVENTVPTSAMTTGDESYLCSSFNSSGICNPGAGLQLTNPFTGQPFTNNQIPKGMISTAAQKFLTLYPGPNYGTAFTSDNYRTNLPASLDQNGFDVRGDQYFGQKLSVYGRFSFKNVPSLSPEELLVPSETDYEHIRMLVVSATYTIKPTLLDEFRFGITDDHYGGSNGFNGTAFTQATGLQGLNDLWFNGLPEVDFTGLTQSLTADRLNYVQSSLSEEFADNLSWIKGRHTLKFGMDVVRIRAVSPLSFFGDDQYGTFTFNGMFTGDDFSDFLLGLPGETDIDDVKIDNDGRSRRWALFAQDSFRVTRGLTFEYGLRWEYHPGYTDAHGQIGNFNQAVPGSGAVVYPDGSAALLGIPFLQSFDACPTAGLPGLASDPTSANGVPCTPVLTASQAHIPEGLRDTSKRFTPRFGFAYKPFHNDKTVVRGGFGAYQAQTMGNVYYSLTGTLQAYTETYINSLTSGVPAFAWPATISSTPTGVPAYGSAYFGTANTINWKEPYMTQWNLSLERDLGRGTGLRLSYIGSRTTNLVWAPDYNQNQPSTIPYADQPLTARTFPNWGVVFVRATGATASYNGAQVELTRRVGTGITLDSTYTWSHNLADNQGPSSNGGLCGETACNRSADWWDRDSEYGNTYAPFTHRWISTIVYQFPFGRGQRFANTTNKFLNGVIGGWQTNNVFTLQSGPWLTPYFTSGDPSGTGSGIVHVRSQHPDRIGPAYPGSQNSSEWFLGSGFMCPTGNCHVGTTAPGAPPPIGRFGNSGVGIVQGPGTINWDFGMSKSFKLSERAKLKFEISFVNVLNHLNLGNPDMKITDANNPATGLCGFGCITSAQGLYQFAGARQGQVSMRIDF
jgi:hypothetical protein